MPARKIVHHEPVTPAKGQTWHGYNKGCVYKIIRLRGKTHIEVADLQHPTARRKTLTREGFMRTFREGAEVWLPAVKPQRLLWHAVVELSHESFGGYTHNDGTSVISVHAASRIDAEVAVRNAVKRRYPAHEYRLTLLTQSEKRL